VAGCSHRLLGVSKPVNSTILNISLVAFFILLGGVFAAAEIALVSLREGQIKALARRGKRGRAVARLAEDPNRFLSAVQIGVTLSGFLSAAFGAATIADDFAPLLSDAGLPDGGADLVALIAITLVIAYFSIVLSELTAKRIALQRSVGVALAFGPAIDRMARLSTPVIWLLSKSTDLAVRVLGGDPGAARERMSDEELRQLVSSHEALSDEERQIVEDVFSAGDRQIREVMIPRTEVDFMDASMPVFKAVKFAADQPHSRYPVIRSSADDIMGFIHVRDLFDPEINGRSLRVGDLARDTLMLPGTREVLAALTDMRREGVHLAIVADEYGGTDGIVTLEDLVEELVGDIRDEYDTEESQALRLVSGDVEVEGLLNLDDFRDETGLELPDGPYETVAGYIVARLGHVPEVGEECAIDGHVLTVVSVDGRRVSRVRVSRRPELTFEPGSAAESG
jgi:putative hemolysin